jgi:hypothetical protein
MKFIKWFLPPEDPHVRIDNDLKAYRHMERIELLNDNSRFYSTWANMYATVAGAPRVIMHHKTRDYVGQSILDYRNMDVTNHYEYMALQGSTPCDI